MYIKRLQVEGGFLDSLDIEMSEGLNVFIGGRGTGKTSIIELLRYCFNVPSYNDEVGNNSQRHARSILGDGKVIATVDHKGQLLTFARSGTELAPKEIGSFFQPVIFSQKEIEAVGLTSEGRRTLIDKFAEFLDIDTSTHINSIRVLTKNIARFSQEIDELKDNLNATEEVAQKIEHLEKELSGFNQNPEQMAVKKAESDVLLSKSSKNSTRIKLLEHLLAHVDNLDDEIISAKANIPDFEDYYHDEEDFFDKYKKGISTISTHLDKGMALSRSLMDEMNKDIEKLNIEREKFEDKGRSLRRSLEEIQKGAGTVIRQINELKQIQKDRANIPELIKRRIEKLKILKADREALLDKMDDERQNKTQMRKATIRDLNKALTPHIRISIETDAVKNAYIEVLSEAFKGSGLRYKDVVDSIASKISPREFSDIVEDFDTEKLQDILGLNKERASKIITSIRDYGWDNILTCELEDEFTFEFLDGEDYKSFSELSTGQRCTVILPIILEQNSNILVLDQPEDHLDNGYITKTLVKSIKDAVRKNSQLIIATHNANIPVLGDATRVIHLKSDGLNGYVEHAGILDEQETVAAITTVMEGGMDAFKMRDKFYTRYFS